MAGIMLWEMAVIPSFINNSETWPWGRINKADGGPPEHPTEEPVQHCKVYSKGTPLLGHRGPANGLQGGGKEVAVHTPPNLSARFQPGKAILCSAEIELLSWTGS